MSWVAKGVLSGNIYSKNFDCIYDCQSFINDYLFKEQSCFKELNNELALFVEKHNINDMLHKIYCNDFINIDLTVASHRERVLSLCIYLYNNPIRCFNTIQNRFACSWDF